MMVVLVLLALREKSRSVPFHVGVLELHDFKS
jgi:hypothetical protein